MAERGENAGAPPLRGHSDLRNLAMNAKKKSLLRFALKYPGWHSCARDSQGDLDVLENQGLLEVIRYPGAALPQFRIAIPQWAHAAIDRARTATAAAA